MVVVSTHTSKHLDLREKGIGRANYVASLLKSKAYTSVDLSANNLGNDGIAQIAAALKVNTSIQHIDLWFNNIGDKGAVSLAEALKSNTSITCIDISDNSITDDGISAIVEALDSNSSITSIETKGIVFSEEKKKLMAKNIKRNQTSSQQISGSMGKDSIDKYIYHCFRPQKICHEMDVGLIGKLLQSAHISSYSLLSTEGFIQKCLKKSGEEVTPNDVDDTNMNVDDELINNVTCQKTNQIMFEPVTLISDGNVYEKEALDSNEKTCINKNLLHIINWLMKKYPFLKRSQYIPIGSINSAIGHVKNDDFKSLGALVETFPGILFQKLKVIDSYLPIYALVNGKCECAKYLFHKLSGFSGTTVRNEIVKQGNILFVAKELAEKELLYSLQILHDAVKFTPLEIIEVSSMINSKTPLLFLMTLFQSVHNLEKDISTFIFARCIPLESAIEIMNKFPENVQTTLAMNAASEGKTTIVEKIFSLKLVSPDCKDFLGNTMLHYATRFDRKLLVNWLLRSEVDDEIENNYGETALDIAKKFSFKNLLHPLPRLKPDQILVKSKLVTTSLSEIYKGTYLSSTKVAIKRSSLKLISKEIRLHKLISGPGIVKAIGWYEKDKTERYLVTKLYEKTLSDVLGNKSKTRFSDQQIMILALDIITGVHTTHSSYHVHLDLKPSNIFLYYDEDMKLDRAVVADIGSAKPINSKQHSDTDSHPLTTIQYVAPEIEQYASTHNIKLITKAADIYSLGIILMEIAMGVTLNAIQRLGLRNSDVIVSEMKDAEKHFDSPYRKFLFSIIKKCIKIDPRERVNIEEVLELIQKFGKKLNSHRIGEELLLSSTSITFNVPSMPFPQ